MDVTTDEAIEIFESTFRHNLTLLAKGQPREKALVAFAEGPPGCGKTTAARVAAARVGQDVDFLQRVLEKAPHAADDTTFSSRTLILAQFEATDIGGLPWARDGKMIRLRPEMLPEHGFGMLFFDEVRKAKASVHNVLGQILLEGRVGEHRISPGFSFCMASNERKDRAGDIELPTHVLDRSFLFRVVSDRESFLKHAMANGFNPLVIFFVKSQPNHFNSYDEGSLAQPTPRSYEKVSEVLNMHSFDSNRRALRAVIEGTLGPAAGHALFAFASIRDKLPDPDYVLEHPNDVPIPDDSQARYAMIASVAGVVEQKTTPGLRVFLDRYSKEVKNGAEMVAFAIQTIQSRSRRILTTEAGVELLGSYHSVIEGTA